MCLQIEVSRQWKLESDQCATEKGHDQKEGIEKKRKDGTLSMESGGGENEGENDGECDEPQFREEKQERSLLHFSQTPSDSETARGNAEHEDRYEKADLVVKIAKDRLEGKNDRQV
jgi:hypothetical protein